MRRQVISVGTRAVGILALITVAAAPAAAQRESTRAPTCETAGALVRVAELPEGSGLAASKRSPGRFWSHNDSGKPVLVALDSSGKVVGHLQVSGARVEDWEAIAVGPCPGGHCIYIGDIGDNDAERRSITIYRVKEPATESVVPAEEFRYSYPDGPRDAETLLVTPNGDVVIVTKGRTGQIALYRAPVGAAPGASATLQRIGTPNKPGKVAAGEQISDGAVSPDGAWIALRTNTAVILYRAEDLLAGQWQEAGRVSVKALGEPQGEGLAFGDARTIYLVGEGGGKSRPGTFGRLTCTL